MQYIWVFSWVLIRPVGGAAENAVQTLAHLPRSIIEIHQNPLGVLVPMQCVRMQAWRSLLS